MAATAAVVLGVGLATWPGIGDRGEVADLSDQWADRPVDTAAYDVADCPARLPDLDDANRVLPDPARIVSVRLCADPRDLTWMREPPTPAEARWRVPQDGLVGDLSSFRATLEGLRSVGVDRCAAIDVFGTRSSLALDLADGTRVLVPTGYCEDVRLGDRRISAGDVELAYLDALSAQRDRIAYEITTPGALTCRTQATHAPVQPGRDLLVEAVYCPPYDEGSQASPVDAEGLRALADAWDRTPPASAWDADSDGGGTVDSRCSEPDDGQPFVVLRTTVGDVAWLSASPCGFSVLSSWRLGEHFEVPIDLVGGV